MLLLISIRPDTRLQIQGRKVSTSTQLHKSLYTDSQNVLVRSPTIAWHYYNSCRDGSDRLCSLVVRVLGYRSGCPGSIPGTTRKKK
jgi:hypothetical protein